MFLGRFITTFSSKNERSSTSYRIVLPKKFRQELKSNVLYLVKGFDGGIWGFSETGWQKEADKRMMSDLEEAIGRKSRRNFFANADSVILDEQGRFILGEEMVVNGGLKDQIIIIGAGDHFEIWNLADWQKII